ncbi:hypothetical protein Pmani_004857 [Petrolisthes manimaculis]|uniref:Uncharacterized protein n=1 Tax=Petrolisthes manimaculis TaxID=1843537 RepID=A0AAE1UI32_9EUCA|nr:hypothetical protein Pmani_004857 [Petrolisthes manimaculis]
MKEEEEAERKKGDMARSLTRGMRLGRAGREKEELEGRRKSWKGEGRTGREKEELEGRRKTYIRGDKTHTHEKEEGMGC